LTRVFGYGIYLIMDNKPSLLGLLIWAGVGFAIFGILFSLL